MEEGEESPKNNLSIPSTGPGKHTQDMEASNNEQIYTGRNKYIQEGTNCYMFHNLFQSADNLHISNSLYQKNQNIVIQ